MVKYMASVVKLPTGKFRAYVKGASEILLDKCRKIISGLGNGEFTDIPLTADDREMFLQVIASYASQSLRTIGVSFRDFDTWPPEDAVSREDPKAAEFLAVHQDMTFIGIFGIMDPIREGVREAVRDCRRAGVFVRMVTGDNILAGLAIARSAASTLRILAVLRWKDVNSET
jgi:Ca2+-transporting ATPase